MNRLKHTYYSCRLLWIVLITSVAYKFSRAFTVCNIVLVFSNPNYNVARWTVTRVRLVSFEVLCELCDQRHCETRSRTGRIKTKSYRHLNFKVYDSLNHLIWLCRQRANSESDSGLQTVTMTRGNQHKPIRMYYSFSTQHISIWTFCPQSNTWCYWILYSSILEDAQNRQRNTPHN